MASKEKLLNFEIFKMIFRKVGWIGVVFQVFLLGVVAFPLFVQAVEYKNSPEFSGVIQPSLFEVATEFQIMVLLFVPLILGMFLYNFLMSKKSSVFIHSLPISRKSLYLHHTLSGVVLLILPIIVTMVVTWLINTTSTLPADVKELYVYLDWIFVASGIALMMFSISTIVAMISGNFIMQGALSLGALLLPFIFGFGIEVTLERIFYGMDIELIGELPRAKDAVYQYSAIFTLISIISLFLSYFVYLKRDMENSSSPIVFKRLRPIFKYGLTTVGLLLASMFIVKFSTSTVAFFITLIVGAFFSYIVAEFVVKKGKISFGNFKGFLVFTGAFSLLFMGMVLYSSTYENKVPNVDEISSVTIDSPYNYPYELEEEVEQGFADLVTLTDDESFKVITDLHQLLIDEKPERYDPSPNYRAISISYTLENGDKVSRAYHLSEESQYVGQELASMPEFTKNYCEFLDTIVRSQAQSINVQYSDQNIELLNTDEDLFNSFIDALIADIEEVGVFGSTEVERIYYEIAVPAEYDGNPAHGYIQLSFITEEFENTVNWLEENGYEDVANSLKQPN